MKLYEYSAKIPNHSINSALSDIKRLKERTMALESDDFSLIILKNKLFGSEEKETGFSGVCCLKDDYDKDEQEIKRDIRDTLSFIMGVSSPMINVVTISPIDIGELISKLRDSSAWIGDDQIGRLFDIPGLPRYIDIKGMKDEGYVRFVSFEAVSRSENTDKASDNSINLAYKEIKRLSREENTDYTPIVYYGYNEDGIRNFVHVFSKKAKDIGELPGYGLMMFAYKPQDNWDYAQLYEDMKLVLDSNLPFIRNGFLILCLPNFHSPHQDFYDRMLEYIFAVTEENLGMKLYICFYEKSNDEDYELVDIEKYIKARVHGRKMLYMGY